MIVMIIVLHDRWLLNDCVVFGFASYDPLNRRYDVLDYIISLLVILFIFILLFSFILYLVPSYPNHSHVVYQCDE